MSVMYIQPETPYRAHSLKDGLKNGSNYFLFLRHFKGTSELRLLLMMQSQEVNHAVALNV